MPKISTGDFFNGVALSDDRFLKDEVQVNQVFHVSDIG
jgi:hypothetical protein